ncbi:MAG: dTDP-4-keto-6-deoxy-D-glucose epimerase [Oxalobacteraceae bacterium]|nr:MAG: dTDP-4-keto-6-deoxy-D-glucose epimerase [Oxalobacteraceae bacterium]
MYPAISEYIQAIELSADTWNQLLIPTGFAHGFMTIEPDTEVLYKVDAPWSREHERALLWNDPDIGIAWPDVGATPTLVERDAVAPRLADFDSPFTYEG